MKIVLPAANCLQDYKTEIHYHIIPKCEKNAPFRCLSSYKTQYKNRSDYYCYTIAGKGNYSTAS